MVASKLAYHLEKSVGYLNHWKRRWNLPERSLSCSLIRCGRRAEGRLYGRRELRRNGCASEAMNDDAAVVWPVSTVEAPGSPVLIRTSANAQCECPV